MAEANLEAVIERLDRLESVLLKLVDILSEQRTAAPPVAVVMAPRPAMPVMAPSPSHEPPRIQVAPLAPPAQQSALARASAEVRPHPETPGYYNPWADWDITVPGPEASVDEVIARLFEAALEADPEMTWATLTRLFHSSQLVGPRAIDHFKGFAWQRLRRNARGYLTDGNPRSFQIAYTDPREPNGTETEIRVFIKAGDTRMPVPLGLSRDAGHNNAWRVSMMSL